MGESEYPVEAIVAAGSDTLAARVGRATDEELAAGMSDPVARKLVEWALLDTSADQMPVSDLIAARSSFAGWPRAESRNAAAERA